MDSTTNDAYVDDRVQVYFTADLVLFATIDGAEHVLLIRRGWAPYKGLWALPGGHVDAGESSRDAAVRECREETGIDVPPFALRQAGVWDAPGRDPRGRYVSVAYAARLYTGPRTPTAGDDAAIAEWVPVDEAMTTDLAFDHRAILAAAQMAVR